MTEDFELGPFILQCGQVTTRMRLRYETHGTLNSDKSNAILFPTWFAGRHTANQWIIGPGRALDTDKYCIVVVNCFGNGESSSPSNCDELRGDTSVSVLDNVMAQRLLVQSLGISTLHAVVGRSMGAQQALQWACMFPSEQTRTFAFCGLPRTTGHNQLLLESLITALTSIDDRAEALRQAATAYCAWSFSPELLRSPASAADHVKMIIKSFSAFEPQDLLMLIRTWQTADISLNSKFQGDLNAALKAMQGPVLLMPISHDMIFPPEEFKEVFKEIPKSNLRLLHSIAGHRAGAPGGDPADIQFLESAIGKFLAKAAPPVWDISEIGNVYPF